MIYEVDTYMVRDRHILLTYPVGVIYEHYRFSL